VQARLAGFEIVVIDDRPAFTVPAMFPREATIRCGPIGDEVARCPIDSDTYVVIATRSHAHDAEALAVSLRQPARYIGMIGSRRKVTHLRREFLEAGRSTDAEFDRLYAPVGLDIGAVTVPEIATSIVAQLIAVRRKGRG
jgi:xanthine dehydrogenase accessory factor